MKVSFIFHPRPATAFLLLVLMWGAQGCTEQGDKGAREPMITGKPAEARKLVLSFDNNLKAGSLPPGWQADATNPRGPLAEWKVTADPDALSKPNVLTLTRIHDTFGGVFNICWTQAIAFRDGVIEVRVRANRGKQDAGGGPIWRAKDANNYYVARYNPLEHNFRLYYVKDGARKILDSGRISIKGGEWFAVKIVHRGEKIEGWINGTKLLEATDTTFMDSGGIGVWTKADAATSFDDLEVRLVAVRE